MTHVVIAVLLLVPLWYFAVCRMKSPLIIDERRASMFGWIGVELVTLVSSVFAMFVGGELVMSGFGSIGYLLQGVLVIIITEVSVSTPRFGAIYAPAGLALMLALRGVAGFFVGLPLGLAGLFFWYGHPQYSPAAREIAWKVPTLLGLLTALVVTILGP